MNLLAIVIKYFFTLQGLVYERVCELRELKEFLH